VITSLLIAAPLGISLLCAHLGRTAVLLALSYLALRRSEPGERKEILEALGPVLGAVGPPSRARPRLLLTSTRLDRDTPTPRATRYLNDTSRWERD
jgi:hypothetical protein